jgi:hypothetical protein
MERRPAVSSSDASCRKERRRLRPEPRFLRPIRCRRHLRVPRKSSRTSRYPQWKRGSPRSGCSLWRQKPERRHQPLHQRQQGKKQQGQHTHQMSVCRCGSVQEKKRQRGQEAQHQATQEKFDPEALHHSFPLCRASAISAESRSRSSSLSLRSSSVSSVFTICSGRPPKKVSISL